MSVGDARYVLARPPIIAGALVAAYLIYYLSPWLPLSLAALAVAAALSMLDLSLAIALVPLAMPFYMLPKHVGHAAFSLGETAILVCVAAWIIGLIISLSHGWRPDISTLLVPRTVSPRLVLIAVFLAAAIVSTLYAFDRHVALRELRVAIAEPILYGALAVIVPRCAAERARALLALVASGIVVAAIGLYQRAFRPGDLTGILYTGKPGAPIAHPLDLIPSVYGSPDNLALLLDRALPVGLALLVVLPVLTGRRRLATLIGGVAGGASLCLMALALALTGSRGGIATAAIVCGAVLAVTVWRDGRAPRWLLPIGAAVVLVVAGVVVARVQHGLSTSTRLQVWQSALHMARDHPLLGVGPDNFLYYYVNPAVATDPRHPEVTHCVAGVALPPVHYQSAAAWQEPCLSHPHSIILDLWLSTGLVGLVAMVALIAATVMVLWRRYRRSTGLEAAVAVAALAIIAATVCHGLVDNSIFLPDLGVAFWLAVAIGLAPPEQPTQPHGEPALRPSPPG